MNDFNDNLASISNFPYMKRVVHFMLMFDLTAIYFTEEDSQSLNSIIILFFLISSQSLILFSIASTGGV